jgi:hypothetical protein
MLATTNAPLAARPTRIVIADDHPLFIEGFLAALKNIRRCKCPAVLPMEWSFTPESNVWQSQPGTVRSTVFTGLQSGKRY